MPEADNRFFLPDESATRNLGKAIAQTLVPGDIILLRGDLGAGKTALARAIIRALMNDEKLDVPSPSFALLQPYAAPGHNILHADLYRLTDSRETDELGLLDEPETIVLVEWPDRAPELEDKASLVVELTLGEDGDGRDARLISLKEGTGLIKALAAAQLHPPVNK